MRESTMFAKLGNFTTRYRVWITVIWLVAAGLGSVAQGQLIGTYQR